MDVNTHLFDFFFDDTPPSKLYTLSLHDALPIYENRTQRRGAPRRARCGPPRRGHDRAGSRSEEHTSELQSQSNLVCRLLLEKKNRTEHDNFMLLSSPCSAKLDPQTAPKDRMFVF